MRNGSRDTWPELLSALYQASQSGDASLRESAFRIFETTPGIIEKQHEDAVATAFARGFKDDSVAVSGRVVTEEISERPRF